MRRTGGGRRSCEWTRHNWMRHTTNCYKQIQISTQKTNTKFKYLHKLITLCHSGYGSLVIEKRKDNMLNVIGGSDSLNESLNENLDKSLNGSLNGS